MLKFTPLEFETVASHNVRRGMELKFTPLEFETQIWQKERTPVMIVKIYSVGV